MLCMQIMFLYLFYMKSLHLKFLDNILSFFYNLYYNLFPKY